MRVLRSLCLVLLAVPSLALASYAASAGTPAQPVRRQVLEEGAARTTKLPDWVRPWAKGPMEPVENVAPFNAMLDDSARTATWPRLAGAVVHRFASQLSLEDDDHLDRVEVRRLPGSSDQRVATVLLEGLADDSVDGDYYVLKLDRGADLVWHVREAWYSWRCKSGRGHASYGIAPCN